MPTRPLPVAARAVVEQGGALERLIFHLQGMRAGLIRYRTGDLSTGPDAEERLSVLLDRYDEALVRAASLLEVPLPTQPPVTSGESGRLSEPGRADVEELLRAAGVEL